MDKCAAVITIHRAGEMSPRGRRRIAAWMRRQALELEKEGTLYAPRFTARYLYEEKTPAS